MPRFMRIFWPWFSAKPEPEAATYIKEAEIVVPSTSSPLATYDNEESWDIEWEDGLPRKITVSRHAKRA